MRIVGPHPSVSHFRVPVPVVFQCDEHSFAIFQNIECYKAITSKRGIEIRNANGANLTNNYSKPCKIFPVISNSELSSDK